MLSYSWKPLLPKFLFGLGLVHILKFGLSRFVIKACGLIGNFLEEAPD